MSTALLSSLLAEITANPVDECSDDPDPRPSQKGKRLPAQVLSHHYKLSPYTPNTRRYGAVWSGTAAVQAGMPRIHEQVLQTTSKTHHPAVEAGWYGNTERYVAVRGGMGVVLGGTG